VSEGNEGKYQWVKPITSNATAEPDTIQSKKAGRKMVRTTDSGACEDLVGRGIQVIQYHLVVKRKRLRQGQVLEGSGKDGGGGEKLAKNNIVGDIVETVLHTPMEALCKPKADPEKIWRKRLDGITAEVRQKVLEKYSTGE
jgi:hypothetical protein